MVLRIGAQVDPKKIHLPSIAKCHLGARHLKCEMRHALPGQQAGASADPLAMNLGMFSVPLSGARAQLQRLDAAANNIANAQTPGYQRVRADIESAAPAGVEVHWSQAAQEGPALEQDLVDTLDARNGFMLDVAVLKR